MKAKELKLRRAIWKDLKWLMKNGTTIEYLESKPEIFYSSAIMSKTLETILERFNDYLDLREK